MNFPTNHKSKITDAWNNNQNYMLVYIALTIWLHSFENKNQRNPDDKW